MRMRSVVAAAGLAFVAAVLFGSAPARAMALSVPAALNGAIEDVSLAEKVHCRSVWRCGYYGCGWRRVCSYYGPPYGYHRPYSYGYYSRPYYRPYYARPYYGYGPYYAPRPRFYVGPFIYY